MSAAPQWHIDEGDDFNSDLHRLRSLLSVICEIQFGLSQGEYDPRVDDLLWVAREMAEGIAIYHDGTYAKQEAI